MVILGDREKFADHTVHDVEHLGNVFTRVIADIDAGGERSLAGTFNHHNVGLRCPLRMPPAQRRAPATTECPEHLAADGPL